MNRTNYTVGVMFRNDYTEVLLILKNRPEWQKGKWNLPGGHMDDGESTDECVARKFEEECNVKTISPYWNNIGCMENNEFLVDILACMWLPLHGEAKTMEDQPVEWFHVRNLPKNMIHNLNWIIPYAADWLRSDSKGLQFAIFKYI